MIKLDVVLDAELLLFVPAVILIIWTHWNVFLWHTQGQGLAGGNYLEMLNYFTIKNLKREVVEEDTAGIFTFVPQVQIALIEEYICQKYHCYEMQFVSVTLFLNAQQYIWESIFWQSSKGHIGGSHVAHVTSVSYLKAPETTFLQDGCSDLSSDQGHSRPSVRIKPRCIPSPYFPLSLLDQQPYFRQLLVQGIRELWCDRCGTFSRICVWSTVQSIWGWLWCQKCYIMQIERNWEMGIFQTSILKEETNGISAEGLWGRTPGTAAPTLLTAFMSGKNPRAGTAFLLLILIVIFKGKEMMSKLWWLCDWSFWTWVPGGASGSHWAVSGKTHIWRSRYNAVSFPPPSFPARTRRGDAHSLFSIFWSSQR